MSSEKSEIINKLIKLHSLNEIYYLNKANNNSEKNKETDITLLNREITELEKFLEIKEVVVCLLLKMNS